MSDLSAAAPSARLARARTLAASRDWRALAELARVSGWSAGVDEPELGYLYADACWRVGDAQRSLDLGTQLRPVVERGGDRRLRLRLVNLLGIALFALGRPDQAERRFHELLEHAADWDDAEFAARAANNLGVIEAARGRHERALTFYGRALAAYQRMGSRRGLSTAHHNLGVCYRELGFAEEAGTHFERAMELARRDGSEDLVAAAEVERAMLLARQGDGRLARSLVLRALERFERLGDTSKRGEVLRVLAAASRALGEHAAALEEVEEALRIVDADTAPLLHAELLRARGEILLSLDDPGLARESLRAAEDGFRRLGNQVEAQRTAALAAPPPPLREPSE